jgi:hypothetical protein
MAKRSRIGGRPGQRRPIQRPANRPATATPTAPTRRLDSVTPEEEARAAELEAAILAEEKAAVDARRNSADRRGRAPVEGAIYSSTSLGVRAAAEYAYVRRDVRRIAIVGGSLLAVLAILDILVNVAHVV